MKTKIIIIFIMILVMTCPVVYAESDWTVTFFGINSRDFKDREPLPIIVGAIMSIVVHEGGHIIGGRISGMNTSMKMYDGRPTVWATNYDAQSDNEKALYHGGGFLAQALVGSVITAIPRTRHSDFTVGFNSMTMFENITYPLGNTSAREGNDCKNLDRYGYNGDAIAIAGGTYAGVLTYISLNKDK